VIPLAPIRLVDTQQRYVEVEIDEVDLPKVAVGMPARVKILAVRREPFKAVVRKVIPFVSSVREQDRTSQLELDVEGEGVLLPAGASADVEIVTSVKDNTLLATPKAVLGRGGDRYVFTVEAGRLRKVPVQVGISGYTATELVGGVSKGAVIAMPSDKLEFRDGLKVQIKKS
jgi:HlyD family secretion protein